MDERKLFLNKHIKEGEKIDLFLSGEDRDSRSMKYYDACESLLNQDVVIARFKHMTGDFATVSAIALWLSCYLLQNETLTAHMIKKKTYPGRIKKVLIYNAYRQAQHSFVLVSKTV